MFLQNLQTVCRGHSAYCTYLLTYLLTPWCRVLLEKLTGLQLVKKFPAFHGTRRFITALKSVHHLSLSWASPIQSIHQHPTSWRSILILSTHLRLGLPSGLLPSGFPSKKLYTPPFLAHTRHMPSPSHSSRFNHPHTQPTILDVILTLSSGLSLHTTDRLVPRYKRPEPYLQIELPSDPTATTSV